MGVQKHLALICITKEMTVIFLCSHYGANGLLTNQKAVFWILDQSEAFPPKNFLPHSWGLFSEQHLEQQEKINGRRPDLPLEDYPVTEHPKEKIGLTDIKGKEYKELFWRPRGAKLIGTKRIVDYCQNVQKLDIKNFSDDELKVAMARFGLECIPFKHPLSSILILMSNCMNHFCWTLFAQHGEELKNPMKTSWIYEQSTS